MTPAHRVEASRAARSDILSLLSYLATQSRTAGDAFLADLNTRFRTLAAHPLSGRVVDGSGRRFGSLRSRSISSRFRDYLVFYRAYRRHIRIVRILHGARDLDALLRLR